MSLPNIYFDLTTEDELYELPTMYGNVLLELMHVLKSLQEVIMTSTFRKNKMDNLIKMMNPKGFEASTSQDIEEDDDRNVEDKEDLDDGEGSDSGSEYGSFEDSEY